MCNAVQNDCGHFHHSACYCNEDQGAGYTYNDEYGDCAFCEGKFREGTIICSGPNNVLRVCPDITKKLLDN